MWSPPRLHLLRALRSIELRGEQVLAGRAVARVLGPPRAELLALERPWWGADWEESGIERWLTTVWPANKEAVFHIVAQRRWIDAARAWLESLGTGSKIGRAAREALAVTGAAAARSRAAVQSLD